MVDNNENRDFLWIDPLIVLVIYSKYCLVTAWLQSVTDKEIPYNLLGLIYPLWRLRQEQQVASLMQTALEINTGNEFLTKYELVHYRQLNRGSAAPQIKVLWKNNILVHVRKR